MRQEEKEQKPVARGRMGGRWGALAGSSLGEASKRGASLLSSNTWTRVLTRAAPGQTHGTRFGRSHEGKGPYKQLFSVRISSVGL